MARIADAAPMPNGISSSFITGSSSLTGSCNGGGGIPDFCYVRASYWPGVSPDGWLSYNSGNSNGLNQSWSFSQNASGGSQSAYLTVAAESWGNWAAYQSLSEQLISPNGYTYTECVGVDKVYMSANGFGENVESGRDANSPDCGYSTPEEPPPVDPDNDGDGVPASSDPDDYDPNNPNPQP
jgi:hypothetical protein